MRTAGTIALVSLLALALCASAASAAPLSMTFTEDRANVGVQLSDAALFAAPDTAPFTAQIDPGSGQITAGALQVPEFSTHITEPIDADVSVDFEIGIISGSFDQATGALTLEGEAGGILTSEGRECTVSTDPSPLILSTAGSSGGTSPRSGAPFTDGLTGAGAIAGQWTDMHATPISGDTTFCSNVEGRIDGPGGIWLYQEGDVAPPSAPQPTGTGPVSPGPVPPPLPACIVPKLAGKTLARAKAALTAAHCRVGEIPRIKWEAKKGKKPGPVVVRGSSPPAGTILEAGSTVDLRIRLKPAKARR